MSEAITYPNGIANVAIRNALMNLTASLPVAAESINDIDVRRIVVALDRKRRLKQDVAIPDTSMLRDKEIRRILQQLSQT